METEIAAKLREKLHKIVSRGYALSHPLVVKTSQELDKYVTAYYKKNVNKLKNFSK